MPAYRLGVIHYPPGQHWTKAEILSPSWHDVAAAIQRMDDNEYPIVELGWEEFEDDETIFNIVGGVEAGFALFELVPGWQFEIPHGSEDRVRLWQSDQGYFCQRKNIADLDTALRLAKVYFETGSYAAVQQACYPP